MQRPWLARFKKSMQASLLYIIVFLACLYHPCDPDLGWHLKYGEYFFQHHAILRTNIYSSMFPGYHWTNSSWATDLLTYAVFHRYGFLGLSILAAFIITLTAVILSRACRLDFWQQAIVFPVFLFFENFFIQASFRGQLLTFLGYAILCFLLIRFEESRSKSIWLLIPLFTLWSNFHGSFILGLVLLLQWISITQIRDICVAWRQHNPIPISVSIRLLVVLIMAMAATLINPFGTRIYIEAFHHSNSPALHIIQEWAPIEPLSTLWYQFIAWLLLLALALIQLAKQKKFLQRLPWMAMTMVLVALSYSSRRYYFLLILISFPVIEVIFRTFKPPQERLANSIAALILILMGIYFVSMKIPNLRLMSMNWNRYCFELRGFSPTAADVLKKANPPGILFTTYELGGWLIWKYPEIKPCIDGRMHLWRDEKGHSAALYYGLIDTNILDIDKSVFNSAFVLPGKNVTMRLFQLTREGRWELLYRDQYALIFVRKAAIGGQPSRH